MIDPEREAAACGDDVCLLEGLARLEQVRGADRCREGRRVRDEDEEVEHRPGRAFCEEPAFGRCRDAGALVAGFEGRGWRAWRRRRAREVDGTLDDDGDVVRRFDHGRHVGRGEGEIARAFRELLDVDPHVHARAGGHAVILLDGRAARAQEPDAHGRIERAGVLQQVEQVEAAVRRALGQIPGRRRCRECVLAVRAIRRGGRPLHHAVGDDRRGALDDRRELGLRHAGLRSDVDRAAFAARQKETSLARRAAGLLEAQQHVGVGGSWVQQGEFGREERRCGALGEVACVGRRRRCVRAARDLRGVGNAIEVRIARGPVIARGRRWVEAVRHLVEVGHRVAVDVHLRQVVDVDRAGANDVAVGRRILRPVVPLRRAYEDACVLGRERCAVLRVRKHTGRREGEPLAPSVAGVPDHADRMNRRFASRSEGVVDAGA